MTNATWLKCIPSKGCTASKLRPRVGREFCRNNGEDILPLRLPVLPQRIPRNSFIPLCHNSAHVTAWCSNGRFIPHWPGCIWLSKTTQPTSWVWVATGYDPNAHLLRASFTFIDHSINKQQDVEEASARMVTFETPKSGLHERGVC